MPWLPAASCVPSVERRIDVPGDLWFWCCSHIWISVPLRHLFVWIYAGHSLYSCYYLLNHDLKRAGYDAKLAADIVFWAAVGGILGSKVYYLLENLDRVIDDPAGMILSGSGLVFLGGLLGGLLAVTLLLRKHKLPWLVFADLVAPLLILCSSIGRIGCFLVGDD